MKRFVSLISLILCLTSLSFTQVNINNAIDFTADDLDGISHHLFGYLDIGTGESDLTWQALAGIGYRFKRFDVHAVYRYLSWDFDDNPALDELDISGPAVGLRFLF